jgi:hypothetical protein
LREYLSGKEKKDFGSMAAIFDIVKKKLQMTAL